MGDGNAGPLVAMTERPTIGGRAWPSVILSNREHEFSFALWCNSTLGLLCHWWKANKTQAGRGSTPVTGIPHIPTIDLRQLSDHQHQAARRFFERIADLRLLPFDQMDEDPHRAELDRGLLVEVLGLDAALCSQHGPLDLLRRQLASEPQVHGDKKTRIVFTESGETTVSREASRVGPGV